MTTPTWLTVVAWLSLSAGFVSAAAIVYDIYGRGLRQPMRVMEAVWPITALYLGPLGWPAYARLGRPTPNAAKGSEREGFAISATHCGAGCALGDVIGEWIVFAGTLTILGSALWPGYLLDLFLGYLLGIAFQYWAIKPMGHLSRGAALRDAIRADTLSILAFEAGMFAWMAVVYFVVFAHPHLDASHAAYWLMMQIAMAVGLATTYPAQIWLVRRGVKQTMGRPQLATVGARKVGRTAA